MGVIHYRSSQQVYLAGLITTITIAVAGFRTFGKWRREELEERRIDVAIEALALCQGGKGPMAKRV
jgi:hypothetical protein